MLKFCRNCGFNVHNIDLVSKRINGLIENCSEEELSEEVEGCALST